MNKTYKIIIAFILVSVFFTSPVYATDLENNVSYLDVIKNTSVYINVPDNTNCGILDDCEISYIDALKFSKYYNGKR